MVYRGWKFPVGVQGQAPVRVWTGTTLLLDGPISKGRGVEPTFKEMGADKKRKEENIKTLSQQ